MNEYIYPPENFIDNELIECEQEHDVWAEQELGAEFDEHDSVGDDNDDSYIEVEYTRIPGYENDEYNHTMEQITEAEENYYNSMAENEGWEDGYDY